jgi:hypothetical protein
MLDFDRLLGNLQTFFADVTDLRFETVEQEQGNSTVIRFQMPDQPLMRGDILVILREQEILFHGMIRTVEHEGWAVAADTRGSRLPARHQPPDTL